MTTSPTTSSTMAEAREDAEPQLGADYLALRDQVASTLHSLVKANALLVLQAARETGASTRVLGSVRRLLSDIELARLEVLGERRSSLLADVLEDRLAIFDDNLVITAGPVPHRVLTDDDGDRLTEVIMDLVTNAEMAGAVRVSVGVDIVEEHDTGASISVTIADDGPGLDFEPWASSSKACGSSATLHRSLRRRGGGLRRNPVAVGASVTAQWTLGTL